MESIHSTSWEAIKDKALETSNLTAEMSVSKSGEVTVVRSSFRRGWRAVKASCGYAVGERTNTNLKEHLERYIRSKVAERVGKDFNEALDDEIQQKVEKIFASLSTTSSTSELIQGAHLGAMDAIDEIQKRSLEREIAPQVTIYQSKGSTTPAVSIITKARGVRRMNIAGGGMKGIVLGRLYQEIEGYGFLSELEHVAGSSVGSISAVCMSCMSAAEFQEAEKEITVDALLAESTDPQYRNLLNFDESKSPHPLSYLSNQRYKGTRGLEVINKALAKQVGTYLKELHENDPDMGSKLTDQDRESIKALRFEFNRRSDPLITFKNLALLHKMAPKKFRDLSIYVYDQQNKKSICYSSNDQSRTAGAQLDIPIVAVVRMSTAHPLAFKPVKTREGGVMTDGGIATGIASDDLVRDQTGSRLARMEKARSNSDLLAREDELEGSLENAETLYLTFQEHGGKKLQEIIHDGEIYIPKTRWSRLVSWVTGNEDFRLHQISDSKTLWDAGPRVLEMAHGDIDTLDFGASKKRITAAKLQAQVRMREQLAIRRNQAVAESYTLAELQGTEERPGKIQTLSDDVLAAMLVAAQEQKIQEIEDVVTEEQRRRELEQERKE